MRPNIGNKSTKNSKKIIERESIRTELVLGTCQNDVYTLLGFCINVPSKRVPCYQCQFMRKLNFAQYFKFCALEDDESISLGYYQKYVVACVNRSHPHNFFLYISAFDQNDTPCVDCKHNKFIILCYCCKAVVAILFYDFNAILSAIQLVIANIRTLRRVN